MDYRLDTVQGGRKRGRLKKRREDNITNGLSLRNNSGRKKERQTEEEAGRQHYKWTIA